MLSVNSTFIDSSIKKMGGGDCLAEKETGVSGQKELPPGSNEQVNRIQQIVFISNSKVPVKLGLLFLLFSSYPIKVSAKILNFDFTGMP